jgi:chromate transporter
MNDENIYLSLIKVFAPLSLISIGGGQSIVGDIHNQAVTVHHWLTQVQFIDAFAISRAAPGPGALLTTLIGWEVSGWKGAFVATMALFVPSSILTYLVIRIGHTKRNRPWYRWAQNGLAPVATGLILASRLIVLRATTGGLSTWLIAAVGAVFFTRFAKVHPIPILVLGGLIQIAVGYWL